MKEYVEEMLKLYTKKELQEYGSQKKDHIM